MTDDATFEREIREMLAGRDPGPAPATMAPTVRARLAADHRQRRSIAVGRLAGAAAVVATLAAALALAVIVSRPITSGPGATPLPSAGAPYTIRPGDGVVSVEFFPTVQVIAGLLAFAVLFVVARTAADRRARIGAALGICLIVLVAVSIGTSDAVEFDGAIGVTPAGEGPPGEPGMYVSVTGDQPFVIVLTITNTSRLPLTIEGLPGPLGGGAANGHVLPRLTGLGLLPRCCGISTILPFEPTTLAPGGRLALAIGGLAGACAIPPGGQDSTSTSFEQISIVYEQLTIWHDAMITLPEPVVVPASGADCS